MNMEKKPRHVKWQVQILRYIDSRPAKEGTQSVAPHHMGDEHNWKKMLALYNETKNNTKGTNTSVWLVGITKDWKQQNIYFNNWTD